MANKFGCSTWWGWSDVVQTMELILGSLKSFYMRGLRPAILIIRALTLNQADKFGRCGQ